MMKVTGQSETPGPNPGERQDTSELPRERTSVTAKNTPGTQKSKEYISNLLVYYTLYHMQNKLHDFFDWTI